MNNDYHATTQISAQEKIAELERRIVALEEQFRTKVDRVTSTRTRWSGEPFGVHWDKMWEEFHQTMKAVFRRG